MQVVAERRQHVNLVRGGCLNGSVRDRFVFNNISLQVSGPCVVTAAETWHGTGNKREK